MSSSQEVSIRRRAILGIATAIGANSLAGCVSWFRREPAPVCPQSPEVSFPEGPLTIDAHCHVFNGTDLQVRDFLSKIAVQQRGALGAGANALGSLLQELAWSFAPDGATELGVLREIARSLASCTTADVSPRLASLRQQGYSTGREQLRAALRRSTEFRSVLEHFDSNALPLTLDEDVMTKVDAIRIIESLPEDVEAYRSTSRSDALITLSASGRSVTGMIDFVLQNFQYRYVSVYDYLRTYNQPGTRVVDLMLPSMVDYDWWLSMGQKTLTPLRVQVEVMRQIALVTGGRVHGFVPYDPLREVAHSLGYSSEDSFSLVTNGIEQGGCVGVKLYPPMGFAPLGNEAVQREHGLGFWARDWLPDWTNRSDMGALLDSAMAKVLNWCEANQVPVMAHTNLSNGVSKDFEALAGSRYWDLALQAFGKLRVSFGHFGDSTPVEDGLTRARAFAELMKSNTGQSGAFAYADAGYFVEVTGSEPALLDNVRQLYDETASKGDAALANRFMYGTDWEMTLAEGPIDSYLTQFVQLFDRLESRPIIQAQGLSGLSSKFFGSNAVNWLGLRGGERTRERLQAFYEANGVPKPDWAAKVDKL